MCVCVWCVNIAIIVCLLLVCTEYILYMENVSGIEFVYSNLFNCVIQ